MKLAVKDYLIIKKLLITSKRIRTCYDKLTDLEIYGNKENDKYTKLIFEIEKLSAEENSIYKYIFSDMNICEDIAYYLLSKTKIDLENNLGAIIDNDYGKFEIRRILNRLNDEFVLVTENNINKDKEKEEEEQNEYDEDSMEKIIKDAKFDALKFENDKEMIEQFIEKDKLNYFLCFLEKEIDNQKDDLIKASLIRAKYNVSYIYRDIEKISLSNMFTSDDFSFQNAVAIMHSHNIPLNFYQLVEEQFVLSSFYSFIACLYQMKDSEYSHRDNLVSSILMQTMIKAWATNVPKYIIESAMDVEELFPEDEVLINTISQKLIIKALKESLDKKPNQKVISIAGLYGKTI